jgi:integrase
LRSSKSDGATTPNNTRSPPAARPSAARPLIEVRSEVRQVVPIENIQDVLGHSTPVITKLLYVDGTEKMQRAAADRLGTLFEAWTSDVGVTLGFKPDRCRRIR